MACNDISKISKIFKRWKFNKNSNKKGKNREEKTINKVKAKKYNKNQ